MLENVSFGERLAKEEYHRRRDELSERLMVLQQQAKAAKMGTVILFDGWHAAGKGARISDLVVNLDPRLYSVHSIEDPVGHEGRLPFMARFWSRLGPHGTMTIFDRSYYDALSRSYVEEVREGDEGPEGVFDPAASDPAVRSALRKRAQRRVREHLDSAAAFERQLRADGYLIVRFFLHITQQEQTRRTLNLLLDPDAAWKVDSRDLGQLQHYDEYLTVFDRWLTGTPAGSTWHVVPALHKRNANVQVMSTLADEMTAALEARGFDTSRPIPAGDAPVQAEEGQGVSFLLSGTTGASSAPAGGLVVDGAAASDEKPAAEPATAEHATAEKPAADEKPAAAPAAEPVAASAQAAPAQEEPGQEGQAKEERRIDIGSAADIKSRFKLVAVPSLDQVRHDKVLSDEEYRRSLDQEQERLSDLSLTLYRRRIPLIIAYEGWDAAGKGGNIKRVAAALDARSYHVHPTSAPSSYELAHPFLWRFWTSIPRTGHVAIFDRTWYGRVMVERIEGFAKPWEWRRAFDEINEFEEDLRVWGAVLVKFWIDVSEEEQLRRFRDREQDPSRRWKITAEDWRNRAKNDLYRTCVNDMLRLTSTEYAPWTVVESDDKHYARVKALRVINEAVERRLQR